VSLNHDDSPRAFLPNALISWKLELWHGICLRSRNVPLDYDVGMTSKKVHIPTMEWTNSS
jgi:hypothetical protein